VAALLLGEFGERRKKDWAMGRGIGRDQGQLGKKSERAIITRWNLEERRRWRRGRKEESWAGRLHNS